MAVTTAHLNPEVEYKASRLLTQDILDHIISQNTECKPNKRENISKVQIRANDIHQQAGCNNSLNIIPIQEFNYNLNKQKFLNAARLRYQLAVPNLPTRCLCGEKFDVQHTISCKKRGFVILRRNKLGDTTFAMLEEVYYDVAI